MQAVNLLMKILMYNGASVCVSSVFLRIVNSMAFWHVLASLPQAIGLNIMIAKVFMAVLACIGLLCLLEDHFEVSSQYSRLAQSAA